MGSVRHLEIERGVLAGVVVLVVGILGFVVYALWAPGSGLNKWRAECERLGGKAMMPYARATYCIRRDAIIEIDHE